MGSEDGRLPEQLPSGAHAGAHGTKAVVALPANLCIAVAMWHLQTGRVQGPYRHLELGDLPAGPVGPRGGRLAAAGGPLPRIRPRRGRMAR